MALLAELAASAALNAFPEQSCALAGGACISYREANPSALGTPVVLLHGIGSNSGSWLAQLKDLGVRRLLAWNAPGYESSTAFDNDIPSAQDYALRLWAWLDALNISTVHLVGHSLGCIVAASAAALAPHRVASLSLLAPAQGYGTADSATRADKRGARLKLLHTLGAAGMAQARGAALLSPQASDDLKAYAVAMMARVNLRGYTQATELLAGADIASDLAVWCAVPDQAARCAIACGDADPITPPAQCAALAAKFNLPFTQFPHSGHLCALEASAAVNTWLLARFSNHD